MIRTFRSTSRKAVPSEPKVINKLKPRTEKRVDTLSVVIRERATETDKAPLEDKFESIHFGTVKEYNSNIKQLQATVLGFWGFGG